MSLSPALLAQLRAVGFEVAQHHARDHDDRWYAGTILPDGHGGSLGGGDVGPCESDEAALVAGVKWLIGILRDAQQGEHEAWMALDALKAERKTKTNDGE